MSLITFEDKEKLIDNPNIPRKNKITAEDINEIKNTVNDNSVILSEVNGSVPKKWKYIVPESTDSINFDIELNEGELLYITVIQKGTYSDNQNLLLVPNDLTTFDSNYIRTGAADTVSIQTGINANNDFIMSTNGRLNIGAFSKNGVSLIKVLLFIQNEKLCMNYNNSRISSGEQRYLDTFAYITDEVINSITNFKIESTSNINAGTIFIFEKL